MSDDCYISSINSENRSSKKVVKENFWTNRKKAENPFGGKSKITETTTPQMSN